MELIFLALPQSAFVGLVVPAANTLHATGTPKVPSDITEASKEHSFKTIPSPPGRTSSTQAAPKTLTASGDDDSSELSDPLGSNAEKSD